MVRLVVVVVVVVVLLLLLVLVVSTAVRCPCSGELRTIGRFFTGKTALEIARVSASFDVLIHYAVKTWPVVRSAET